MTKAVNLLIDYETCNNQEHNINESAVLELGAVAFEYDENDPKIPDFQELKDKGFRVKFGLKAQKGVRVIHKDTLLWWKQQSDEAKKIIMPSAEDVTVEEGHRQFMKWAKDQGLKSGSQIWCRGNSFDFPILYHCLWQSGLIEEARNELPSFWAQRDVRTRIEALMGRNIMSVPLPEGSLPGFVHHAGLDDCAKDVVMMAYAAAYAFELEEIPHADHTEPGTEFKYSK
ncbi:exonuclease [Vibrio phage D479]